MKTTNALKLRQSLGTILRDLNKTGEPILVEKDRKPAAVLISLDDYRKRFVDRVADQKRKEIALEILKHKVTLPKEVTSLSLIRALRNPKG